MPIPPPNGGIIGLMKSAALDLGVHKITVSAVIPGLIDTLSYSTPPGLRTGRRRLPLQTTDRHSGS
jgi:NAD(P)-dependent dehydrogenase (short-subunit alcohol dehydrogenase family)